MEKFGPFANIVLIALALTSMFSVLLIRTLGNITQYSNLTKGAPSFLITNLSRVVNIIVIATIYLYMDIQNRIFFLVFGIFIALVAFFIIIRFDRLIKIHVIDVDIVDTKGRAIRTEKLIIGTEQNMRPEAKRALDKARKTRGGLSLPRFMAGYGSDKLNDSEAIWPKELLANISNEIMLYLMMFITLAILVVFIASAAVALG